MNAEVTLTVNEEFGNTREVLVQSKRFTIGRTPDNDLAIPNANLSRRHAVIEAFEGVIQITDCGSQNGTEVNGTPVVASAILHDGDLITLAGVCDITVTIDEEGKRRSDAPPVFGSPDAGQQPAAFAVARDVSPPSAQRANPKNAALSGEQPLLGGLGIPLVVSATAGLAVVIVAGLLLLILTQKRQPREHTDRSRSMNGETANQTNPTSNTSAGTAGQNSGSTESSPDVERIEKTAIAVMQRISSDDKPYSFSDKALRDIGRKVGDYRNAPALPGYLEATQRSSAALFAMARQEGLEPGLLIYAVLAQTDGGRVNSEPLAVARGIISDLLAVRNTFGTTDAESSLILLAAYKMGGGGKRSHPLLVTIRRLVKHPLTQRNVWYLNERGGLDAEVYDFVVSFLALAVIAQNPAQFGVTGSPLVF